ncbi:hypothetical protein DPMN_082269 [Dreissena polymorpha]|uniref:Uncharacterized protein n=1 Tax=Dreissena polymorpha TaxID=45954 RepID=A0A9D3Y6L5_DREPO|nr:hypothetical protein DPMN_082269 [Dreissena polymorpha]
MIGQKLKTAPPTGGHVFQRIGTTFELNQAIIKTNILTNFELGRFNEDGTRNVASRVFTSKCLRKDIRRTKTGHKSSPEQSGELKSRDGNRIRNRYPDNRIRYPNIFGYPYSFLSKLQKAVAIITTM